MVFHRTNKRHILSIPVIRYLTHGIYIARIVRGIAKSLVRISCSKINGRFSDLTKGSLNYYLLIQTT